MFLFTYGTLMQGESRAGIMRDLGFEKVCNYKANGFLMFHNFYGKYPIIFKSTDKNDVVIGEIYTNNTDNIEDFDFDIDEYNNSILDILDNIEGVGVMYRRETITAKVKDRVIKPYIYMGNYEYWKDYLSKEYGILPLVNNLKWSQKLFE